MRKKTSFTKIINVPTLAAFVDETSTALSDAGIRAVLFVMLERILEVGCTCLRTIVISKCFVWIWKKCGLWIKVKKNIVSRKRGFFQKERFSVIVFVQ